MSVEPSTLNFEMLIRNTKPYRNVIPIRAALWSSVAELALIHGERTPGRFEWGYMVQEKSKVCYGYSIKASLFLLCLIAFLGHKSIHSTEVTLSTFFVWVCIDCLVFKYTLRFFGLSYALSIISNHVLNDSNMFCNLQLPQGTEVLDTIQGVSVDFLSEVLGLPGFDLLKIDIEGSEKEILAREHRSSFGWLNTAKMAMFEVHEDMRVGAHEAVASTFFHRRDWEWIRRFGEYHVYKKKGWGFVEHMQKNLTRNIEG